MKTLLSILSLIVLMSIPSLVNECLISESMAFLMFVTFSFSFIISMISVLNNINPNN